MFDIFTSNSSSSKKQQAASTLVHDYIQRHLNEFLNPIKDITVTSNNNEDNVNNCWSNILQLDKSKFLKGWKPTTNQFYSLYDQLFHYYFQNYAIETEEAIHSLNKPLQWFPPQWFEHAQPLPSGRMGQVYLISCRIPHQKRPKKMIIREINLSMVNKQQQQIVTIPKRVIGITAIKSKHENNNNHYKLALVSLAIEHSLEQLIPQVDQWTFQKICRLALSLASAVRDLHKKGSVQPNLQPRNILISNIYDEHALKLQLVDGEDDWPSIPLSTRYGRWPYIAPEICYGHANTLNQMSNIYSLGMLLWQLASGVIFPNSVTVCPQIYQLSPFKHIEPVYQDIIVRCLSKNPKNRPTAETICEALIRVLMTDMTVKKKDSNCALHANEIRDRQITIAKYLTHCQPSFTSKQALHDLMEGASLSKRMMIQVTVSRERYWQQQQEETTTVLKQQQQHSRYFLQQRDNYCEDENGCYIPSKTRKKQKYEKRQYRIISKNDENIYYGADLPELMQMGFA